MFERRLFLLLLSVGVLGSTGAAIARGGDDNTNRGQIEGKLNAVNFSVSPPTITIRDVTLKVTSDTIVEIDEQHSTLDQLELDVFTEAKFNTITGVATKVEQGQDGGGNEDATVTGRVTAADAEAGTVSLDLDEDEVADLTVTVDANTEIEIGSNHISSSQIELLNGLDARVEYFTGTLIAKEINAQAGQSTNISGTVTAVNATERTIGIDTGDGVALVHVPKDASIKANGKKVKLQSIREGAKITAKTITNGSGDLIAQKLTVKGRSRR